ncbi:MAG: hypothetical protein ABFD98_13665 [Syntrophobacteraceae bacterium]
MHSNPYQSLVSLLSNILEAYTTAFFKMDPRTRHLEMVASQTLSKFLPETISLPLEQSGILAQVYKVGHIIHVDKLPEATTALASTLPFYREGESHIKGLFVVPVGDGAGVLYVDTKYGWGFNDKQQKWIREVGEVLHDLLVHNESMAHRQDCARILDCWEHIDEVSFKGLALEDFSEQVIGECTRLLGADLGFVALREAGESSYRLLAASAGAPRNLLNQAFLVKQGLVGRVFQNMKPFFISRLNPQSADHFLFASSESLPHHGSLWVLPAQLSLGQAIGMTFLTRQPTEWHTDYQNAVAKLFRIYHLLLEQLYLQEECRHLQTFDFTTGFVNSLVFESSLERLLSTSMQNSTPFVLALVQFEPWQILYTKSAPGQIREWQATLAAALRQALPSDVLIGQMTENRFGLLFSGLTEQDAGSCLASLKALPQRIFGGRLKKVRLMAYLSSVGFPQDSTRSEELWTLANQRLFAAFRSKNENESR